MISLDADTNTTMQLTSSIGNITAAKSLLRSSLKKILSSISLEESERQSRIVTQLVLNTPEYRRSRRICIYLNMPQEISTYEIMSDILSSGRQCFIPRYTKSDMEMLELLSMDDYHNLPTTNWNIKQPDLSDERVEALNSGGLDLILMPGLGFSQNKTSNSWNRLGRGKGYYDKYLEKCQKAGYSPITIGLAFKEQIVDEIPTTPTDTPLNKVLYPLEN